MILGAAGLAGRPTDRIRDMEAPTQHIFRESIKATLTGLRGRCFCNYRGLPRLGPAAST